MTDRTPTQILGNGAIRYAEYNAGGNFVQHRYLLLDDEPTQSGTPLSKHTLLTDETAELIWPEESERPDDPTVDEAFRGVLKDIDNTAQEIGLQVGDILPSIRTDPGDDYLLCNGTHFNTAEYPELAEIVAENWEDTFTVDNYADDLGTYGTFRSLKYLNGEWVLIQYDHDQNFTVGALVIKQAATPAGPWVTKNTLSVGYIERGQITYGDGIWVIWFYDRNGSRTRVFYSTTLDGEWNESAPLPNNILGRQLIYANGIWVLLRDGGRYIHTTTDLSAEWTLIDIVNETGVTINSSYGRLTYANGLWAVTTKVSSSIRVYYTDDPTSEWAYVQIGSGSSEFSNGIQYVNGSWFVPAGNSSATHIWYTADDLNGTWRRMTRTATNVSSATTLFAEYIGGKYRIITSDNQMISTSTLTNAGTVTGLGFTNTNAPLTGAFDGTFFAIGFTDSIAYSTGKRLPLTTLDNAYVYIRAKKED